MKTRNIIPIKSCLSPLVRKAASFKFAARSPGCVSKKELAPVLDNADQFNPLFLVRGSEFSSVSAC